MLPAIKHQSELSYYLGTQIDEGLCQRPSCLCLLITATTVRFVRSRSGVSWGAVPNDPLFPVGCNSEAASSSTEPAYYYLGFNIYS